MPALVRLLRRPLLRPTLLDSDLQAGAAGGAGLHAPPPQGQPRAGAVPALPVRRRTELPDAARPQRQALAAFLILIVFGVAPGGGGQVQVRVAAVVFFFHFVSPLVPSHVHAVFFDVCKGVGAVVVVGGGENETPRVSEKLS